MDTLTADQEHKEDEGDDQPCERGRGEAGKEGPEHVVDLGRQDCEGARS